MSQLTLATRAPASQLNAALLVASYVNEAQVKAGGVTLNFEDAEVLSSSAKAAVEFKHAEGTTVYGAVEAIKELSIAFPILKGKSTQHVCTQRLRSQDRD